MSENFVLTEDEALELLAFLVTAARTQMDEPHEYGPLRLLTAANRLGDFIMQRASPETQQLLSKRSIAGRVSCQAHESLSWNRGIFGPFIGQRRQVLGRFGASRE
jgi:uncharacterized protein DUF6092